MRLKPEDVEKLKSKRDRVVLEAADCAKRYCSFSSLLSYFMRQKGLSQEMLAERMCVEPKTIQRMLKDDRCTFRSAVLICFGLQLALVDARQLLGTTGYCFIQSNPQHRMIEHLMDNNYCQTANELNDLLELIGLQPL